MPGFYTTAFFCGAHGTYASNLDDIFVKKDFAFEGGLYGAGTRACFITNTTCSSSFIPVMSGDKRTWKQISGGSPENNYGIDEKGNLWAWGTNTNLTLGTNNTIPYSTPVQIGTFKWKCVFADGNCLFPSGAAAIRCDGTLWMWGTGACGRLGNNATTNRSSPVQVLPATGQGSNCWKEVAVGQEHALGIKTDGTLWAWGKNRVGQLGDGTTVSKSTPVQIGTCKDWYKLPRNIGVVERSFAIKCDGTLWSWGLGNANLVLGDANTTCRCSPVQVITTETFCEVAVGTLFGAAITRGGRLYVWGRNCSSLLGIGSTDSTFCSTPIETCCNTEDWKTLSIHTNAGVTTSIGGIIAIKKDGSAWAWGRDDARGVLGVGTTVDTCYNTPVQVLGGNNWISVSIAAPQADGPAYMLRAETTSLTCASNEWFNDFYKLN